MRQLDIGVAGCGIAGLAAALLLKRAEHRVTLYERFAAPRPIGSGLMIQPTGLAVLERMELAGKLCVLGAPISRLFGKVVPSGKTVLDVRYEWLGLPGARGLAVHRAALFGLLHGAATTEGVPIETGRTVTGTTLLPRGRRCLLFEGGESQPHDLVVDGLGAGSPLAGRGGRSLAYGALWASLDWPGGNFSEDLLEQRYRRASVMAGVLPIGRTVEGGRAQAAFFWSLRGDRFAKWRERGLEAWKQEVREVWPETAPFLDQIEASDRLTFARYAHRTVRRPAEPALIHIGDSWHSTSPQLGQGANMALLDAWALAKALGQAAGLEEALQSATALRRRHVRLYQALSALFTPAYQSDGRLLPFVRDVIVPPFGRRWPATRIQAAMLAGTFGGALRPLGLEPGLYASCSSPPESCC
jgi:2-polyprenyl-6-methoxyphenol hydroxylase-like FAD-dependent oxidoreductase